VIGLNHARDNNLRRSTCDRGIINSSPSTVIFSWSGIEHTAPKMFFQISATSVFRVTQRIEYPCVSNRVVAAATAAQVFPVPTECHKRIPRYGDSGIKK